MKKKRKRQCGWSRTMRRQGSNGYPPCTCVDYCLCNATVKRNGRYYCRQHDPVRLLKREMNRQGIRMIEDLEHMLWSGEGRL